MQTIENIKLNNLTSRTDRIVRLRDVTAQRVYSPLLGTRAECSLLAGRSWLRSAREGSHMLRRGILAGDILRGMTPVIDNDELLVGKFSQRTLTPGELNELDNWQKFGEPATSKANGQKAHMSIDYERLLRLGVTGVRALIAQYRGTLDLANPDGMEKDLFYQGCLAALDGLVALSNKYADLAEQLATIATPSRAIELHEIARVCRKVPEYPAETFAEAMQAVHFVTFAQCAGNQMGLFQLGRPDRYLLPYYRRDIAAGRITSERAQELVDCLSILLNEYTPRGLAVGWMVGGRNSVGDDVTNELSSLFVRTIGHVRLAYPAVGVCWTPETPPELMQLAARLLARGYSHPALFNDDLITSGLTKLGLSHRDATEYIHSTCVEITPIALSNVYVASPYYNLVQCLHDVLGIPPIGEEAGEMPKINSFDDLITRFRSRLHDVVHEGVSIENKNMMSRAHAGATHCYRAS